MPSRASAITSAIRAQLDARLRELAILQVGWIAQSPYEWSHHVKIGYEFGVTDEDIKGLIAETDGQAVEPRCRSPSSCCRARAR